MRWGHCSGGRSSDFKPSNRSKLLIIVVFKPQAEFQSKPHQQVFLSVPVCYPVSPPHHWAILNSALRSLWSQVAEGPVLTGEFWFSQVVYWKELSFCKRTSRPSTLPLNRNSVLLSNFLHWKYPPDFKLQETSKEFVTKTSFFLLTLFF